MSITIDQKRYVSFDKNGVIHRIGRRPDELLDSFEIEFEKIQSILDGRERLIDYIVDYDFIEKKYVLKSRIEFENAYSKEAFIYEVPSTLDDDYAEIKIVQDNIKKCWRIEVHKQLDSYLQEQNISVVPQKQFYSITKKGDPNILYRLLKFDGNEIPFDYDFEFDNLDISIYTIRRFGSYLHEVINE
jgi:hypothetical protein